MTRYVIDAPTLVHLVDHDLRVDPSHEPIAEVRMRLLGDRGSRGTAWRIALYQDWDTLRSAG